MPGLINKIMKGLKKFFSDYDPNTGEINCVDSNGLVYQHELRHKIIDEKYPILMNLYSTIYMLGCVLTVLLWNPAHMIVAFVMTLILECDAMIYGWRHRHE